MNGIQTGPLVDIESVARACYHRRKHVIGQANMYYHIMLCARCRAQIARMREHQDTGEYDNVKGIQRVDGVWTITLSNERTLIFKERGA